MNPTFTIFGATGDLTYRKLMPALYNLTVLNCFTDTYKIIAVGRKNYSKKEYIEYLKPMIMEYSRLAFDEEDFKQFIAHIEYFQMDFTQPEQYRSLNEYYEIHKLRNHVYYLAVAPQFFQIIAEGLKYMPYSNESKIIIEKPFGKNIIDADELNQRLEKQFQKQNIYHIDHYLGKEMIQNIQTIRFRNTLFKNNWSHEAIQQIQISALEKEGIGSRGSYYDQSGALKDMVESHLLQILAILTMEEKRDIHEAALEVLQHLQLDSSDVVLGQYEGYLDEKNVQKNSKTETYAALKLTLDLPQWQGVNFYLQTGKKMSHHEIEAMIQFKATDGNYPNVLQIKIQPSEGVYLQFNIKKPGSKNEVEIAKMDFCQSCIEINRINTPQAYERLLLAAVKAESEYFASWEEIKTSAKLIEKIQKPVPVIYPQNTNHLEESDALLAKDGSVWIKVDHD